MKQFPDVASARGAPMGRRPVHTPGQPVKAHLFRVRMVDGDYDDGGAYWGGGPGTPPLYCARDDDGEFLQFDRAWTKSEARSLLVERFPELTFYT